MQIIGQQKLLNEIDKLIIKDSFPRFSIIVGITGSGKKTIAKEIANKLNYDFVFTDNKVDSIRHIIEQAYKISKPIIYIIDDADKISLNAKNSLLKIVEEPPQKAYFILTAQNENQLLETLKSRAQIFKINPYTPDKLEKYVSRPGTYMIRDNEDKNDNTFDIIRNICNTPGEVDLLLQYDILEFYQYVEKVVNNIDIADEANIFKIGQKIKFKEIDEGYDLELFFKIFMSILRKQPVNNDLVNKMLITNKCLRDLSISGINKQMLFDSWLFAIRKY